MPEQFIRCPDTKQSLVEAQEEINRFNLLPLYLFKPGSSFRGTSITHKPEGPGVAEQISNTFINKTYNVSELRGYAISSGVVKAVVVPFVDPAVRIIDKEPRKSVRKHFELHNETEYTQKLCYDNGFSAWRNHSPWYILYKKA